jgi:transposase-like protein
LEAQEAKRQYRLTQWIKIIQQCRSSGQTVSAWCAENSINAKSYYYWLRRVRMAACEALPVNSSNESSIVPIAFPVSLPKEVRSIPSSAVPIVLRLGSATVEIHNGTSPELIAHTVKALIHVR